MVKNPQEKSDDDLNYFDDSLDKELLNLQKDELIHLEMEFESYTQLYPYSTVPKD